MSEVIRISEPTYKRLQSLARGFDTPGNVIDRLLDFYEPHHKNILLPEGGKPRGENRIARVRGAMPQKAGWVTLQELVDVGLVKDEQILHFYHTRLFQDEQAEIIASSNKLRYKADGKVYSISDLAKLLLKHHGFKRDEHSVAGPKYWKTKDGKLLNDLNEEVRRQRGDRK
jgi:predicted CopG family antitoxin